MIRKFKRSTYEALTYKRYKKSIILFHCKLWRSYTDKYTIDKHIYIIPNNRSMDNRSIKFLSLPVTNNNNKFSKQPSSKVHFLIDRFKNYDTFRKKKN